MADNTVQVTFGATTDELVSGVARVKDTIAGLAGGLDDINGKLDRVAEQFGKAFSVEGLKNCVTSMAEFAAVSGAVKPPGNGAAIAADFLGIQEAVQKAIAAYQKLNATPIEAKDSDALKVQMMQYQEMIKGADDLYKLTADKLASQVRLHQISYDQETAALLSALEARNQAEQHAFAGEQMHQTEGTAAYERILKERQATYDKYLLEKQKATEKSEEEDAKQWKAAADQIAGAFNSQLKGLLAGTTSWSQAMKNISADLALKFIENQVKATAEFLAEKAREVAAAVTGEGAKTTAATTGAGLRSAAEVASGQTSILAVVANAIKSIYASGGETGAKVTAAVADEAGPAAPAIGAAAAAATIAPNLALVATYDVGTDYVVRSGLAIIHQGEQIRPAVGSGPYTGKNDRAGDTHVALNISAMDSRSVERFFHDNAKHMIRAINNGIKSGAHLGLRGARA
ncbi:MAG: hypothetical protein WB764_29585 [Xanthobacteraceae bacterium]